MGQGKPGLQNSHSGPGSDESVLHSLYLTTSGCSIIYSLCALAITPASVHIKDSKVEFFVGGMGMQLNDQD